jgi:transcriptional regulator with GAF, ATPase, and Fis domain
MAPESAILVYAAEDDKAVAWTLKAVVGEVSVDRGAIAVNSGTLGAVATGRVILRFTAEELTREDYAHLDVRQSFTALTYVPIMLDEHLLGCVEIVSLSEPPTEALLGAVAQMADYAAIAFGSALTYEAERTRVFPP